LDKLHNKTEKTVRMNLRLEISGFGTELKDYIRLGMCRTLLTTDMIILQSTFPV